MDKETRSRIQNFVSVCKESLPEYKTLNDCGKDKEAFVKQFEAIEGYDSVFAIIDPSNPRNKVCFGWFELNFRKQAEKEGSSKSKTAKKEKDEKKEEKESKTTPKRESKTVPKPKPEVRVPSIARPDLQYLSREEEVDLLPDIIQSLVGTYDFDKGKRVMKTSAQQVVPERDIDQEREEAASVVLLVDTYNQLYNELDEFIKTNQNGNLKITEKKIVMSFPKGKDKEKIPDVEYPNMELWNQYKKQQATLFKYLSKDFIGEHWEDVLTCGILRTRSTLASSQFNGKEFNRLGIMSTVNINISDETPKIILPEGSAGKLYKDYYWLITNAKNGGDSKSMMKPSDVFDRRISIISHPGYVNLPLKEIWEECSSNLGDSPIEKIWKLVFESPYMFEAIMLGAKLNPFIETSFKRLINHEDTYKLLRGPLVRISYLFSSLCFGPIDTSKDLKKSLDDNIQLFSYDNFSWVAKVLNPESPCVVDINV